MKQLFFIALLPPTDIQQIVQQIKRHCAEVYQSRAALKSPPHITLQPPFKWPLSDVIPLEQQLSQFAQARVPIPIMLEGFGAFRPHVIYVHVAKTPELLNVQKSLMATLESSLGIVDPASKTRPFAPHVTVAFRDLTKSNFRRAWLDFERRSLHFEFSVAHLTLLAHNGKFWEISREFPFSG